MKHAYGDFDVKVLPLPLGGPAEDSTLGRMSIEKEFHGDLEGSGKGQMLTGMTAVAGSAAYVAIERVNARLEGRKGGFALLHRGTMHAGASTLEVTIVPESGTDGLVGIAGTLLILIEGKKHRYDLEYSLPPR